jgi:hypothetical protein
MHTFFLCHSKDCKDFFNVYYCFIVNSEKIVLNKFGFIKVFSPVSNNLLSHQNGYAQHEF